MQEIPNGQSKSTEKEIKDPKGSEGKAQNDKVNGGGNGEDMELGELDLEGIEKASEKLKDGYIPFQQRGRKM